jgi:large subunit ribosomal protein L4
MEKNKTKAKEQKKSKSKVAQAGKTTVKKNQTKRDKFSLDVLNEKGETVEKITLPREIFGVPVNKRLLAQYVRVYLANQRRGTASTKTRGEVKGSTRKIYRQKGTGRARHGAITAPIFVGGGVVFGPKPRDYSLSMPKKMRQKALFSALSLRFREKNIFAIETPDIQGKTKEFVRILKNINLIKKDKPEKKLLLVVPDKANPITQAARNIENVNIELANLLNAYEVLENENLIFLKESIDVLQKHFLKTKKSGN